MIKTCITLITLFCTSIIMGQNLKNCSSCADTIIKIEQIENLSVDDIRYLINDLYARKGYQFKDYAIDLHYTNKEWYNPVENNNTIVLNSIEKQNIDLFKGRRKQLENERAQLIKSLLEFKDLVLKKEQQTLKSKYNFDYKKDYKNTYLNDSGNEQMNYLDEVLIKVDIKNINWYRSLGWYKVTIDNLNTTVSYEVIIEDDSVYIKYDFDSGSEDITDEMYSSEAYVEFTYLWEFQYKSGNLKFIQLAVAG